MAEGEPAGAGEARVSVEPLPGGGVRIDDRIDRRTFTVRTDRSVAPERLSDHPFDYPQDVAVAFTAGHLELLPVGACFVHGPTTSREVEQDSRETRPDGRYVVQISGPLLVYVEVRGPVTVAHHRDELTVDLERPASVVVGARSFHEPPATTVTTTTDPVDLMAAVSTFGSELKTLTCDRSYPTLRGHPPALEVGRELSVPDGLDPPAPSIRLEVPRRLGGVLPVAPLAYYLGAPVEPAARPALVVDGADHRLDGPAGFEAAVERTLKRTLFMDCLVRTATPRNVMLRERERLEGAIDLDIGALEGRDPTDRLAAYQQISFETIEPHLPDWRTVAHVRPTPAGIEAIPFLANDLALVRSRGRHAESSPAAADGLGAAADSDDAGAVVEAGSREVVRPPSTDSVRQVWVGPGVPVGASKALPTAYHNRIESDRRDAEAVEVAVVCNDQEMFEEGEAARDAYGSNQHLPFDVSVHYATSTTTLAGVFESTLDYVHYVGHVRSDGFECTDGTLEVSSVDEVGVDIAFLNACQSYEQGFGLIDRGAVASVVTFDDVLDDGAIRIGKTMARLLNHGFSVDRALSIARARSIVGSQYLVVGDADADISQAENHIPWTVRVETVDPDTYRVAVVPYPTKSSGMGAQFHRSLGDDPAVFLVPKALPPVEVAADRLAEYLSGESGPVVMDGRLTWSAAVADSLRQQG